MAFREAAAATFAEATSEAVRETGVEAGVPSASQAHARSTGMAVAVKQA